MRALITGVTGQDGSYLAEQLTAAGDTVSGMIRGQRHPKREWLEQIAPGITLAEGDLLDQSSLQQVIKVTEPDVVYNLGALTYVGMSWQQPAVMSEVTGLGALRILEAIRHVNPAIRFVQASSSEMFGGTRQLRQDERTRLEPRSPYGVAKAFAHHTTVNYRESYGLHASSVIMFNHESPRRGEEFVTRKVSRAVARIAAGKQDCLTLGNLDACRDWGWAPEYMTLLPRLAALDEPGDWVIGTGETHTVADLCREAFFCAGMDWRAWTKTDERFLRPADVHYLRADPGNVCRALGWKAEWTFTRIVQAMVAADMVAEATR